MATNLTPPGGLQVGDVATLTLSFTTAAGGSATVSLADVVVRVRPPDRSQPVTVETGDLTAGSTGVVSFRWTCAATGAHHVHARWSSGEDGAAVSGFFTVDRDPTA
jgi:hypothetical protein